MVYALMQIVFFGLDVIYFFIKLCPTRHKVVFLSRQSNKPSSDMLLVEKRLHETDQSIETVKLCRTLDSGIVNKIRYIFHMFVQMYHIATSETAVLDSYCIVISCLHHKKKLKVIQMWHGLGCFKKFGYSVLGKSGGSSLKIAKAMHMHENYDMVFTSSRHTVDAFMEGFNVSREQMVIAPLPKVDLLRNREVMNQKAAEIWERHPELNGKFNLVYAPTFRKDESALEKAIRQMIDYIDFDRYNLILCLHPISKIIIEDPRIIIDRSFYSYEMATVGDAVISDYSATTYEMAILDKKIYYYVFDRDSYDEERGFYTPLDEFPGPKCRDLDSLFREIEKPDYDQQAVRQFVDRYITPDIRDCCGHIVDLILKPKI